MEKTSALHRDYNPENPNPRANKSKKWEVILKPIWKDIVEEGSDFDAEGNGLILVKDPFQDGKLYLRKNLRLYISLRFQLYIGCPKKCIHSLNQDKTRCFIWIPPIS